MAELRWILSEIVIVNVLFFLFIDVLKDIMEPYYIS